MERTPDMEPLRTIACYSHHEEERTQSSSGGIFTALAKCVLSAGGIVYGVDMSEDCYSAEYISVTNEADLSKLRGSKYLQAKVGDSFQNVKADLAAGKTVLFSGTGCQVNGLKSFLGKEYENLVCVDVICHGVPSPALWEKYVCYREEQCGGKLKSINFRNKDRGWEDFGMKLGHEQSDETQRLYISKDVDPYMQMFLRDYCLRPSCYSCAAKEIKMADITLGDFWGIEKAAPEMNDGWGTSLVMIRSRKGEQLFDAVSEDLRIKDIPYQDAVRYNRAECSSPARPALRDTFFADMSGMAFADLEKKYASPRKVSLVFRVKQRIKRVIKNMSGGAYRSNAEYGLLFEFDA